MCGNLPSRCSIISARAFLTERQVDALKSSHPVSVIVNDPNEIMSVFDAISYKKVSAIELSLGVGWTAICTQNPGIAKKGVFGCPQCTEGPPK